LDSAWEKFLPPGGRYSCRLGTTHDNFLNLPALMSRQIDGELDRATDRDGEMQESERASVKTETFSIFLMACVRVKVFHYYGGHKLTRSQQR